MKNTLFFVLGFFLLVKVNAQRVLTINDLSFNDAKEKLAFQCLKKNAQNADSLLWVHCISYQSEPAFANITNFFSPIILKANKEELAQKNIKAQEKWLQKHIIDVAFKTYNDIATLNDFTQKKFNKSTASILLTYFFEKANLPYVLSAEANQLDVYIGNYDNKQKIDIQSTKFDVSSFVDALKELTIIDEESLMKKSNEELYADFKGREAHQISFNEATADVYLKKSIQYIQNQTLNEALIALNKSIFLQKEVWKDELKAIILIKLSSQVKANDFRSFQPYFELVHYPKFAEKSLEVLFEEFNNETQKNLITDVDIDKQYQMRNFFLKEFEHNEEITKQIKITHHSFCIDSYLYQGKKEQSLKHADTTFMLAPRNVKLQSAFADLIIKNMLLGLTQQNDLIKYGKTSEELLLRYPFLRENPKVNLMVKVGEGVSISNCLLLSNNEACVKEFFTFKEANYEKMKEVDSKACEEVFSNLYSSLCAYYYQISEFDKGNKALEEGIKLCPNNEELKRKYDSYKEEFESVKDIKVEYAKPTDKDFYLHLPPPPPPPLKTKKKKN